jgi:hypothetical protein
MAQVVIEVEDTEVQVDTAEVVLEAEETAEDSDGSEDNIPFSELKEKLWSFQSMCTTNGD